MKRTIFFLHLQNFKPAPQLFVAPPSTVDNPMKALPNRNGSMRCFKY